MNCLRLGDFRKVGIRFLAEYSASGGQDGRPDLAKREILSEIKEFKKVAEKISCQNGLGKVEISKAVEKILLGETGPIKELRAISSRFFNTEAESTKCHLAGLHHVEALGAGSKTGNTDRHTA